MSKDTAFIDTTILTDATVKTGERREKSLAALRRYKNRLVSGYVIKEFKAGPLRNLVWYHNKLVSTGNITDALKALHAMSLTPARYTTATAIEALANLAKEVGRISTEDLVKRYGKTARLEQITFDRTRLALKRLITKGWRQRRSLATSVVHELSCYRECDLSTETSGIIDNSPLKCKPSGECCLGVPLRTMLAEVQAVEKAVPTTTRREDQRRKEALRHVRLGREVDETVCRALGDAVIVIQCPSNADVLTTNDRDHAPLAAAIRKTVATP